ncbi:MAG: hypothetical protein LKJ43_03055 [Lentilactobacillus buchneri]|jgi:hypothetical protein|nr:hypothetical protein [Lentilactobacillus buchneri]MCI1950690.1 hypothetical protein [Lentilactobacillus buchneri]MCI2018233.1 hypothetical protein [Lentilactobacillus buchneri]MCI2027816.1 hypothetical protein [Lentilactobacillus buchneri]
MDKTFLEKRIHERAEKRADDYFGEIRSFFYQHTELGSLVLKPVKGGKSIPFLTAYQSDALLNNQEGFEKFTNWKDIRKRLVEKYEKEETDEILSKLENINYLLGE